MVWDLLIFLLVVTLAVAGWNIGIINSWRSPFGIVASTLIARRVYIDAATYVVGQTRMQPTEAAGITYLAIWCVVDVIIEPLLRLILPFGKKSQPLFFDRGIGAIFGIIKALLIIILPCIVVAGPVKIPPAPQDKAHLIQPMDSGVSSAALIAFFTGVGKSLYPRFGDLIVNKSGPSFKPDYANTSEEDQSK